MVYNTQMRFLGIDYGTKRVGIALSDQTAKFALPKMVLPNNGELLANIADFCLNNDVGEIVIGESKDFSGWPNKIMAEILKFKSDLESRLKLPVHLEPEFLTSAEAERIQGKNDMLDASAAAIILQSYLNHKS